MLFLHGLGHTSFEESSQFWRPATSSFVCRAYSISLETTVYCLFVCFCTSRLFFFSGHTSALQSLLFHCPSLHMAGHTFSSLNFTWDYVEMIFFFTSPTPITSFSISHLQWQLERNYTFTNTIRQFFILVMCYRPLATGESMNCLPLG